MKKLTLARINRSLSTLTISALAIGSLGLSLGASAPLVYAVTTPTTNAATVITSSDATLNGTNGDTASSDSSFWVSTSTFSTAVPVTPAGVFSTPSLGAVGADAPYSAALSSVSGILPIMPGTTYFFVAWTDVGGTWSPGTVMSFTTLSAPTITNVSPASGSTAGATAITITGTGFMNGATVSVGGVAATSVVVVSDTSITATTPAGTAGAQDVVVVNPDSGTATSAGGFTYVASVANAPTTLAASGITSSDATLNGLNGSSDAGDSSFWVSTSTFSTAVPVVPAGVFSTPSLGPVSADTAFSAALSSIAGILPVTASTTYYYAAWTNVGGTWSPGAVMQFTTLNNVSVPTAPVVSALSPMTGTIAGGDMVTITGTGFTGATAVHFGGIAATGVVVNNDTSITATSPATSTAGVVDVTVTTPLGTSATSSADRFTYALTGVVTGAGVLHVDSINSVKTSATADGTFANGWIYTFNITVPTDETNLSMQFSNWLSGANIIPVAGNMQISSAQANNAGAEVTLSAANTYSSPALVMTGDLDPSTPGLQVQVTVDVAVPAGTPDGSYSTNYGVQTQP